MANDENPDKTPAETSTSAESKRPWRRILARPDAPKKQEAAEATVEPAGRPPATAELEPEKSTPSLAEVLEPYADLLGEVPDSEIAAMAGVHSAELVTSFREVLEAAQPTDAVEPALRHLPASPTEGPAAAPAPPRSAPAASARRSRPSPVQEKLAQAHDRMGVVPDHVIAKEIGCSVGSVRNYRAACGIEGAPRSAWATRAEKSSKELAVATKGSVPAPSPKVSHGADADAGVDATTHEPTLADAVLLAAAWRPGASTADDLARDLGVDAGDVEKAVEELRARGHLQRRRGRADWGSADRLRPTKAGEAVCYETLRREVLGG